jgi:Zn-dependent peptidase ImmA (M78 family)/transcriptional regulator with XRE-family HTH domain
MKINPEMVTLAREYRVMTQEELALRSGINRIKISRIEGGISVEIDEDEVKKLATTLQFPIDFFSQSEEIVGYGSSAYYYRKKADLSAADRKRIHGLINLLRIGAKKMLSAVEIEPKRSLRKLDLEDYGGSPRLAARAVRQFWQLPDGPIKNVTSLLESAGIIVISCDFKTKAMDATSVWLNDMPPLIFINQDIPGDRMRFTLCHELAHLVIHEIPHELMEDEADSFASEFLMPEMEIKPQFLHFSKIGLRDLATLKPYWKVSMGSLIERGHDLEVISDNQRRYLWVLMAKHGYKTNEPLPIEREVPKVHSNMLGFFKDELKYSLEDMANLFKLSPLEVESLYGSVFSAPKTRPPHLRVVG